LISVLAAKIGLAVAWVQVYGVRQSLVLKASSGFAEGFLIAVLRMKID
jgi:hypothetical protein